MTIVEMVLYNYNTVLQKQLNCNVVVRWDGMVSRPGDGPAAWSRCTPPGWTESTEKSAFIWRKRSQAMAVLTRTWSALRRETRRCVITAIPLWIMQSTHSSSAQSGVRQARPSVRQWVPSSLLTRWSLWCSCSNGSGRSSSHLSHLWWRRERASVQSSSVSSDFSPQVSPVLIQWNRRRDTRLRVQWQYKVNGNRLRESSSHPGSENQPPRPTGPQIYSLIKIYLNAYEVRTRVLKLFSTNNTKW